jgi:hypothetical protein
MDWLKISSAAQVLKDGVSLLISKNEATADQAVNETIIQKGYELEQALEGFIDALKEKTK